MATLEETLALVKGLAEIQQTYRLDVVCVGEVKLSRSAHEFPAEPVATAEDDAELEEWSA